ncbi:MFS transporter [Pseudonocardia sp. CA-107938]|uniref:MFS transporter n=1 Tax=Pseudonocardia sp. CA-107938 TaxID=3240021 RepID=UPI003D91DBDC
MAGAVGFRSKIVNPKLLVLAIILGFFDGADLSSMGVTLSRLSKNLELSPGQAGLCASASLVGVVIGATVGGRWADRKGRRPVLLTSALALGIFAVLTAVAWDFPSLLVVRLLAGLGMGGLFPVLIAAARASAVPDFRSTAISIVMASGPVGALATALVGLAPDYHWVFLFGGIGPLVAIPAILMVVRPGSEDAAPAPGASGVPMRTVFFGEGRLVGTVLIWVIAFCTILVSYVLINWLPSMLQLQGFSRREAGIAAVVYSVGGIFGNLVAGRAMDRGMPRTGFVVSYVGIMACLLGLSMITQAFWMFVVAFGANLFVLGAQLVAMSLTASFYPDEGRTTGLGAMVAAGRVGSVVGPLLTGLLLSAGLQAESVMLLMLPGLALSLVIGLALTRAVRRRHVAGAGTVAAPQAATH